MAGLRLRGQGGLLWRMLPAVRLAFALTGRGWNRFYAWMLDRQERANSIQKLLKRNYAAAGRDKGLYDFSRGAYHADYLKRHGLMPHHDVLDIGCGLGRTAVPLLRYLEPGRYVGIDLSRERIRMAKDYVALEGLEDRGPTFIANSNNDLAGITGRQFDFLWAQSVYTHMPPDLARDLTENARKVMRPGGTFLFNFSKSETDGEVRNVKDFYYTLGFYERLANDLGFACEVLDDWQDDLPPENRHDFVVMLRFTLPAAA